MAAGSTVSTTVRTVHYAEIRRDGDMITFAVAADGFLYNMVRIMAGTLIDVAHGRIAPDAIQGILAAKNRSAAGFTAPPQGLCLNKVVY
jgi:tRNA pseudouridine38-40 synthase